MKRFWLLVVIGFLLTGCSQMSAQKDVYHVMFEKYPNIYDSGVYLNGRQIGEILEKKNISGKTEITIFIQDEYRELMKDNAVFFVDFGRLNFKAISNFGKSLEPGESVLGFNSKLSVLWFKTKSLLTPSSKAAARKAKMLSISNGAKS